jgi:hypothetical protein
MRTTSARLDPVGRLRLPRRATLLRLAAAAALLLTAAGVLYAGDRAPAPATPPAATTAAGPGGRLPVPAGAVGVPVTIADPAGLALLLPGDRVELFAVPDGGSPDRVAGDTPVLAVDRAAAALLLALTPEQGRTVVAAPAGTTFAVLVRGGG